MGEALRRHLDQRMEGLRQDRNSFMTHWKELADYILPRRYRWLVSPNEATRGSPLNSRIIDETGTIAARRLASGMMSGITSPTRPWFKLRIETAGDDDTSPVNLWLAEVERRMLRVFSESNFYNSIAVTYFDLVVFGTASMIIYEDYDDVIRCHNPCLGEFFLAMDHRGKVDTIYRELSMTVKQVVEQFGLSACSENVRILYTNSTSEALSTELVVRHAIEPNRGAEALPKIFAFREVYWEAASREPQVLSHKGFHEFPGFAPRWDLSGNDSYGRSPGMDALGAIKQLQQESKRKGQALDKMVNPPMRADITLKNQPNSLLPGGVTFVSGMTNTNPGFAPIFQVQPPVAELMQDIAAVQQRIGDIFFNDLFMMISQLQTVRSATEIDARREEKLILLGPVLERFENEALDPAIDRVFAIMSRAGLLPPAPPEIANRHIQVQYVSMLAEAQRSVGTSSIERVLAQVGNLAAVDQTVLDNVDFDAATREYASLLNVAPKIIRPMEQVLARRKAAADQIAAQQAAQQGMVAVEGAKALSDTDVGGGQNALAALLGR